MKTDTEQIEAFLLQNLNADEERNFLSRLKNRTFKEKFLMQARVHLAALIYGRNLQRTRIISASEKAFSDNNFSSRIASIFK